jgi:hypothetical protein
VLIMDPVLETPDTAAFALWPVAGLPPYRFMALSDRMTAQEVGTALAALVGCAVQAGDDDRPVTGADDAVRRLLAAETVTAPGGLRVHDPATGVTVTPGCCCGLEDWREWFGIADGATPWFGHDPSPRLDHTAESVRLWPDGRDAHRAPTGTPIEIPALALFPLLRSAHQSLNGFLSLVGPWATRHVPSLADPLTRRLADALAISEPLPDATAHPAG